MKNIKKLAKRHCIVLLTHIEMINAEITVKEMVSSLHMLFKGCKVSERWSLAWWTGMACMLKQSVIFPHDIISLKIDSIARLKTHGTSGNRSEGTEISFLQEDNLKIEDRW